MILVHDNDLGFISGAVSIFFICCTIGLTLQQLPSDTLSEYIRNHAPVIQQVRYGGCLPELRSHGPRLIGREELSPGNESVSGTEASIITVATLCHELFEVPCQSQNNFECPQLTETINASDDEISQFLFQENVAPQSGDPHGPVSISLTDNDLSNAAIPTPIASSHDVLLDPDRPQGSSISPAQPVSRMDTPVPSLIERTNRWQPSLCVIRRLVADIPTDYRHPYNRLPQTVPSSTPTQPISNSTLLSIHESYTSGEAGDMGQGSVDEGSRPLDDIENASPMTVTINTHIGRRFSIGSSSSGSISGGDKTDTSTNIGTGSLSLAPLLRTSPFLSHSAHDLKHESSAAPLRSIAPQSPSGGRISVSHSAYTLYRPTSSNIPLPQVSGPIFCDG
jgi:hypothetical protein